MLGWVNENLSNFSYLFKVKEIIYVGRLNFVQKRVYRMIEIWNYLEERFSERDRRLSVMVPTVETWRII